MIKMEPRKLIVNQEQDLKKAALELIEFSGKDRILCFYGEMGAGKTTFIRYLCRELGVLENVSSPTFSIVNEYRTQSGERVYHFDFYRLNSAQEALDIGIHEYFDSGSYCLVEWPEKILNLLPQPHTMVRIVPDQETRTITFSHD